MSAADQRRPHVVVTWPGFGDDDSETVGLLRSAGLDVRLAPNRGGRTTEEVRELVADARAAIVSSDPFDRSVFEGAANLCVIARTGIGTDSIDLSAATETGVVVTTTPGANEETCADHAVAMILAAVRRIVEHDRSVRRREWQRAGELTPWDLHGKLVGIVGFGQIGKAVARRLQGFDTEILVCDPAIERADALEVVGLEELLARAEIVSLHLPLLSETRRLIGSRELGLMRPDAVLVNTARGGIVDEASLVEALTARRIRAAALDVFESEPPVSRALLELPNVVLTPHVGGLSVESIREMTAHAARAVVDVLSGKPSSSVVNPAALDHPRFRALVETMVPPTDFSENPR